MTTLHNLIERYTALMSDIDAETGEVPPEVSAELDALAPQLEHKIEALAGARARLKADAKACADLAASYRARVVARENEIDRLERYTLECMQVAGLARVRGATATAYVQASTSVEVTCAASGLPSRYLRVVPARIEPDKVALKSALEAGETIEGASLRKVDGIRFR